LPNNIARDFAMKVSGMLSSVCLSFLASAPLHADCDARKPFATSLERSASEPQLVQAGEHVFERNCVVCHGMGGAGGRGPTLQRARLPLAPDDAALCELIENGIPPEMPDGTFLTDEDVNELVSYVRSLGKQQQVPSTGDPAAGARVFQSSGCPQCHIRDGRGEGVGPELTHLGDRRSARYVREAISAPASRLPAEFLMVRATTAAGEQITGIRVNEDTFSIQIKSVRGEYRSLDKRQLKSLDKLVGQTPMPAYAGVLSEEELSNLVAYLLQGADR
jgi:cytochrome c oxidase cbb3-type subunit III